MPMTSATSASRMGRTVSSPANANSSAAVAMVEGGVSLREPFKHTAGELQVLPRLALVLGFAQQIRRMIRDDQRGLKRAEFMHLATHCAKRALGREQILHGDAPDGQDQSRTDEFDLALQIRHAGGHFGGCRVAICRRPALEDIGDIYIGAAS